MPRERRRERKRPGLRTGPGDQAKERHLRDRNGVLHDWSAPLPRGLVARPVIQQPKSKHHSYFEFVENKEKKKKLDFQITTDKTPPPGFTFVPIGNPELTTACKELSREKGAMIFIVSNVTSDIAPELSLALNREGHHIRETIVEEARALLGEAGLDERQDGAEPIPESQEEINKQADAALRDLFPRIPHTDRQAIIERSFRKGATMGGKPLVGVNPEISLSRRAQLSVIAHIRHEYTRYDQLLRETSYANARKVVAPLCLDYILKWRGDEETGRDQLDEILREVVVISDTESDDENDDEDDDQDEDTEDTDMASADVSEDDTAAKLSRATAMLAMEQVHNQRAFAPSGDHQRPDNEAGANKTSPDRSSALRLTRRQRRALRRDEARGANRDHRGFQRYQAVMDQAWQQARERQQRSQDQEIPRAHPLPMDMSRSDSHALLAGQRQEEGYDRAEASRGHGFTHGLSSEDQQYYRGAPLHERYTANGSTHIAGLRHETSRPSIGLDYEVSRPPQNLQDYLVPSIEPASPVVPDHRGQHPDASARPYYSQRPWEVVSDRQQHDAVSRGPPAYANSDEPVLVRRLPATRRVVREPISGYAIEQRPRYYYEPSVSSSQSVRGYVAEDGTIVRRQEPRPLAREQYLPQHELDPGVSVRQPVTFTETRVDAQHGELARGPSRAIPLEGSYVPIRQSDYRQNDGSSRPIVIRESSMTANPGYTPRAPVGYARQEPEYVVIRQAPAGDCDNHRIQGVADAYPIERVERSTPMEFVRVSNSFPRPHGTALRSEAREARQYEQLPYRPLYESAYERATTQRPADAGGYPARQERVVRVEYVDYESLNDGRGQPISDDGRLQQSQYRAATRPASDAAYQQAPPPPPQRDQRHDDVIYID